MDPEYSITEVKESGRFWDNGKNSSFRLKYHNTIFVFIKISFNAFIEFILLSKLYKQIFKITSANIFASAVNQVLF